MEKKDQAGKAAETVQWRKKIGGLCEILMQSAATVYLLVVACMVPLYMYDGYYGLGTVKFQLYRNVSFVILPAMVIFAAAKAAGSVKIRRLPQGGGKAERRLWNQRKVREWLPELFLVAYGAAVIFSFCLSSYKKEGLFGAEGWHMGLFSQLSFLALYFYYACVWKAEKEAVGIVLGVSCGICLLAVLNRFGIWPLDFRGRSDTTLSTIGNVNWLCGYLSVLLPAGTAVFWGRCREGQKSGKWQQAGTGFFTAAAFLCTAVQGSDSGFLIIGTALYVLFLISCGDGAGMSAFWDVFLTASGAVFAGLFGLTVFREAGNGVPVTVLYGAGGCTAAAFAGRIWWKRKGSTADACRQERLLSGMRKGGMALLVCAAALCAGLFAVGTLGGAGMKESLPSVFIFNENWGNGRGAIWMECLEIWKEQGMVRKLFGVGPDCLKAFLYAEQGSRPILAQTYAQVALTNCHNEWMTLLMNIGLLGLAAYAGFLVSAAVRFLRKGGTAGAAGALAVITYTVHNMVSFQQITSTPLLFLAMGLAWNSGCITRENKVE